MVEKPSVVLDFEGPGGNSMAILAVCRRAARKAGWPKETVDAFLSEAMCNDRSHLIDMVFEHFDVQ